VEFQNGCSHIGLTCNETSDDSCFCKPCVKAHEVDVYTHAEIQKMGGDPYLVEFYGEKYPGCEKMELCATFQQT